MPCQLEIGSLFIKKPIQDETGAINIRSYRLEVTFFCGCFHFPLQRKENSCENVKIHAWFYLISAIQVNKVVCQEQSHAVDEQPFDVVGKPFFKVPSLDQCYKNLERDCLEVPYSSVTRNKIAHRTESKDELFITSQRHKGAQKVNNDMDMPVWPKTRH